VTEITNLQRFALKPEPIFDGATQPRHQKLLLLLTATQWQKSSDHR
jgi:hypothetical protein